MALDHQQALLLDVLRRAGGGRVSYEELRDAGVEYPASVVSELELAGLPLERCAEGSSAACRLRGGVRFEQPPDELSDAVPSGHRQGHRPTVSPGWPARAKAGIDLSQAGQAARERARRVHLWLARYAGVAQASVRGAASPRWLAPAALIAVGAAFTILAVGGRRQGAGAPRRRAPAAEVARPDGASDTPRIRATAARPRHAAHPGLSRAGCAT